MTTHEECANEIDKLEALLAIEREHCAKGIDEAHNMAGHIAGLNARIKELEEKLDHVSDRCWDCFEKGTERCLDYRAIAQKYITNQDSEEK